MHCLPPQFQRLRWLAASMVPPAAAPDALTRGRWFCEQNCRSRGLPDNRVRAARSECVGTEVRCGDCVARGADGKKSGVPVALVQSKLLMLLCFLRRRKGCPLAGARDPRIGNWTCHVSCRKTQTPASCRTGACEASWRLRQGCCVRSSEGTAALPGCRSAPPRHG